jgi:hypothetical protein
VIVDQEFVASLAVATGGGCQTMHVKSEREREGEELKRLEF